MVETGVFFSLVDSLQQLDVLEREPHFQVITAMVESGASAHFANGRLYIVY